MNSFSELIEKLANGTNVLDEGEKQALVLQARVLEQAASIVTGMVAPGSGLVKIDNTSINNAQINTVNINDATIQHATAGDGNIILDQNGIRIIENSGLSQTWFAFRDPTNTYSIWYFTTYGSDDFAIAAGSGNTTGSMNLYFPFADGQDSVFQLKEDPAQANRSLGVLYQGDYGSRLNLGSAGKIDMRVEGTSGGSTFIRMMETTTTPPGGGTDAFHMYMKGDKVIIQFNASGTAHYFYLDLTATTNQSWIYSATAP